MHAKTREKIEKIGRLSKEDSTDGSSIVDDVNNCNINVSQQDQDRISGKRQRKGLGDNKVITSGSGQNENKNENKNDSVGGEGGAGGAGRAGIEKEKETEAGKRKGRRVVTSDEYDSLELKYNEILLENERLCVLNDALKTGFENETINFDNEIKEMKSIYNGQIIALNDRINNLTCDNEKYERNIIITII